MAGLPQENSISWRNKADSAPHSAHQQPTYLFQLCRRGRRLLQGRLAGLVQLRHTAAQLPQLLCEICVLRRPVLQPTHFTLLLPQLPLQRPDFTLYAGYTRIPFRDAGRRIGRLSF